MDLPSSDDVRRFKALVLQRGLQHHILKKPHTYNLKKGFVCQLFIFNEAVHTALFIEKQELIECILSNVGINYLLSHPNLKENPDTNVETNKEIVGTFVPYFSEPQVYHLWKKIHAPSAPLKNEISLLNEFCQLRKYDLQYTELNSANGFLYEVAIKQIDLICTGDAKPSKKEAKLNASSKALDLAQIKLNNKAMLPKATQNTELLPLKSLERYQPSLTRQSRRVADGLSVVPRDNEHNQTIEALNNADTTEDATNLILVSTCKLDFYTILSKICKLLNLNLAINASGTNTNHLTMNLNDITIESAENTFQMSKSTASFILVLKLVPLSSIFQFFYSDCFFSDYFNITTNCITIARRKTQTKFSGTLGITELSLHGLSYYQNTYKLPNSVEIPASLSNISELKERTTLHSSTKTLIAMSAIYIIKLEYRVSPDSNMCSLTVHSNPNSFQFKSTQNFQSVFIKVEYLSICAIQKCLDGSIYTNKREPEQKIESKKRKLQ